MKLKTAIEYMGTAHAELEPALYDREATLFAIDSREVQAGSLFFALSQPDYKNNGFNGEFEDATKYVASAFERGAVAAVVRTDRAVEHRAGLAPFVDRLITVEDTIKALQNLARGVYLEWNKPVVAITGSAGKTTAKEFTAHILEASGKKVLRNIKNFNNGLGHPLTVLRLADEPDFDIAVLEMGMSTPMNEIARLCRISPPDIAVVLNVLPVHLEHLGSIENIARAKAEIVEGMKQDGIAILNADDQRVAAMADLGKGTVITFGIESDADISAENLAISGLGATSFILKTPKGASNVTIPLGGRHDVSNALAAAAVGFAFGMTSDQIAAGLNTLSHPPQRGEVLRFKHGFTVINDSYNSNPAALMSMVRTLADGAKTADRTIVVAGEMLELGPDEVTIHERVGREIAGAGVDRLIGVRGLAAHMVKGAVSAGLANAEFAADSIAAGDMIVNTIRQGDAVLVKGSRGVRTEKVIEKLMEAFELEDSQTALRKTT